MMTDDEIIAVVQAHKEGKKIQEKLIATVNRHEDWKNTADPHWNFHCYSYRVDPEPTRFLKGYCFAKDIYDTPLMGMIKVEQIELDKDENPLPRKPREWVVALHKDGTIWSPHSGTTGTDYSAIHVREVIE